MKLSPFLFVSIVLLVSAQSLTTNTKSIFKHDLLIGNWAFESMTTIRKAKREEKFAHIDFFLSKGNIAFSVDVKARKKVSIKRNNKRNNKRKVNMIHLTSACGG